MKKGTIILFISLLFIFSIFNVSAGIFDSITGRATTQHTNVSVTISGAPSLGSIENLILACESSSLSYKFNATDSPSEILSFSLSSSDPFFVQTFSSTTNSSNVIYTGELFSTTLVKSQAALNYSRTIFVTDGTFSDSKAINISVIEINNAPSMTAIATQSVNVSGGSVNFYYKVNVSDTENGNQDSGNISFNSTFTSGAELFNISAAGIINKTFTSADVGSYSIRVCATDLGIPSSRRHPNITYCGQGDGTNSSDCESFTLTISQTSSSSSPSSSSAGGSSSGGGGISCLSKWGCKEWGTCQNAFAALQSGILTGEDYRIIDAYCILNGWEDEERCGFTERTCIDVNSCNNDQSKPLEVGACFYTQDPSCTDGIKNCHSEQCEFLVDCGGPCGACATCSDAVRNQGEEGIDCGGPCPDLCIAFASPGDSIFEPFKNFDKMRVAVIGLVLSIFSALFIVLAIKLARVMKLSRG